MEMPVETDRRATDPVDAPLQVHLLGPLMLCRGGVALILPASRKVRALFAYLALASRPVPRSYLCELLWDVPDDPRGELRWSLSKIRSFIDEPGRQRISTQADTIGLDLSGCCVDALEILRAHPPDGTKPALASLHSLATLFTGDFLEGLDIERCPGFGQWLTMQRRRFRSYQAGVLEQLVELSPDEASGHLDQWLAIAPFDLKAHSSVLRALARHGRIREGNEHLASAARLFEAEGLETACLHEAWRDARASMDARSHVSAAAFAPPVQEAYPDLAVAAPARRASIAVMPFVDQSEMVGAPTGVSGALAHDVITRLAKLRSLFVIASGTVLALRDRRVGPADAARMLSVDYLVSGTLRRLEKRLSVAVQLIETNGERILWTESFSQPWDDALLILDEIGNRIVASIAGEIEMAERNRAILKPPNSLDAWEAHHRGLWHMYRFNKADNEVAQQFFALAIRLDPTFSRAHAGLSFTHFQNAFQGWNPRDPEIDKAFGAAGQSLLVDDRDPAAHWAMGRALWLRGCHDQSIGELEQAVELSPNFAQGHYALAFVHSQTGDPTVAIASSDHSRALSPFDPMLFGMLGARAMAHVRLGQFEEAADWAVKAAARPNAHAQILAIAALSLGLAGRMEEARTNLASIRKALPRYGIEHFLTAMHFTPEGERHFRDGARKIGMG